MPSITLFESMLGCYVHAREQLIERRRGAADHVMVEIDERLTVNARTIESIRRAMECLRGQLNLPGPDGLNGVERSDTVETR